MNTTLESGVTVQVKSYFIVWTVSVWALQIFDNLTSAGNSILILALSERLFVVLKAKFRSDFSCTIGLEGSILNSIKSAGLNSVEGTMN